MSDISKLSILKLKRTTIKNINDIEIFNTEHVKKWKKYRKEIKNNKIFIINKLDAKIYDVLKKILNLLKNKTSIINGDSFINDNDFLNFYKTNLIFYDTLFTIITILKKNIKSHTTVSAQAPVLTSTSTSTSTSTTTPPTHAITPSVNERDKISPLGIDYLYNPKIIDVNINVDNKYADYINDGNRDYKKEILTNLIIKKKERIEIEKQITEDMKFLDDTISYDNKLNFDTDYTITDIENIKTIQKDIKDKFNDTVNTLIIDYNMFNNYSILNTGLFPKLITIMLNPEIFCDMFYSSMDINESYKYIIEILNALFIQSYRNITTELPNSFNRNNQSFINRDTQICKSLLIQNLILYREYYIRDKIDINNNNYKIKIIIKNIDKKINEIKNDEKQKYIFNYTLLNNYTIHVDTNMNSIENSILENFRNDKNRFELFIEAYYYNNQIMTSKNKLNQLSLDNNKNKINLKYDELMISSAQVLTYVKERNDAGALLNLDGAGNTLNSNSKNPRYNITLINDNKKIETTKELNYKLETKINYYDFKIEYFNHYESIGYKADKYDHEKAIKFVNDNKQYMETYNLGKINRYYSNTVKSEEIAKDPECGLILLNKLRKFENIIIVGNGQSGSGKTAALLGFKTDITGYQAGLLPELSKQLIEPDNSDEDNKIQYFTSATVKLINLYLDIDDNDDINTFANNPKYNVKYIKLYNDDKIDIHNDTQEQIIEYKFDIGDDKLTNDKIWKCTTNSSKKDSPLDQIITEAFDIRETEPTKNNPNSSRSHIVACVTFTGKSIYQNDLGNLKSARIVVCDLAGVEDRFTCLLDELLILNDNYETKSNKYAIDKTKLIDYDEHFCNNKNNIEPTTLIKELKNKDINNIINYIDIYNDMIKYNDKNSKYYEYIDKFFNTPTNTQYNINDDTNFNSIFDSIDDQILKNILNSEKSKHNSISTTVKYNSPITVHKNNNCKNDNIELINNVMFDFKLDNMFFDSKDSKDIITIKQNILEYIEKSIYDEPNISSETFTADLNINLINRLIDDYRAKEKTLINQKNQFKNIEYDNITFNNIEDINTQITKNINLYSNNISTYTNFTELYNNFILFYTDIRDKYSSLINNFSEKKKKLDTDTDKNNELLVETIRSNKELLAKTIRDNNELLAKTIRDNDKEKDEKILANKTGVTNINSNIVKKINSLTLEMDGIKSEKEKQILKSRNDITSKYAFEIQKLEKDIYINNAIFYILYNINKSSLDSLKSKGKTEFLIREGSKNTFAMLEEFIKTNQKDYDISDAEYVDMLNTYITKLNEISNSYTLKDIKNFNKKDKKDKKIDVIIKITDDPKKIAHVTKYFKLDVQTITTDMKTLYDAEILTKKSNRDAEIIDEKKTIETSKDIQIKNITNRIHHENSIDNGQSSLVTNNNRITELYNQKNLTLTNENRDKNNAVTELTKETNKELTEQNDKEIIDLKNKFESENGVLINQIKVVNQLLDQLKVMNDDIKSNIDELLKTESEEVTVTIKSNIKTLKDNYYQQLKQKKNDDIIANKDIYIQNIMPDKINNIKKHIQHYIRLSQLEFNCNIRRKEGFMINTSLKEMQKFIGSILIESAKTRFNELLINNNLINMSNKKIYIYNDYIKNNKQIIIMMDNIINVMKSLLDIKNLSNPDEISNEIIEQIKKVKIKVLQYFMYISSTYYVYKSNDDDFKNNDFGGLLIFICLIDTIISVFEIDKIDHRIIDITLKNIYDNDNEKDLTKYMISFDNFYNKKDKTTPNTTDIFVEKLFTNLINTNYKNYNILILYKEYFNKKDATDKINNLIKIFNDVFNEKETFLTDNKNIENFPTNIDLMFTTDKKINYTGKYYDDFVVYLEKIWTKFKSYIKHNIESFDSIIKNTIKNKSLFPSPLLYFPPSIDKCVEQKNKYDNEYTKFYTDFKKDSKSEILFKIMTTLDNKEIISGNETNGFGLDMSKSTLVLFTVINITPHPTLKINNPPNPPFININKLKLIYKIVSINDLNKTFSNFDTENKNKNIIIQNINKICKSYLLKLGNYPFYEVYLNKSSYIYETLNEGYYKIITNIANFKNNIIDFIDSINATTLIGTVDFEKFTKIRNPDETYFICDNKTDRVLLKLSNIENINNMLIKAEKEVAEVAEVAKAEVAEAVVVASEPARVLNTDEQTKRTKRTERYMENEEDFYKGIYKAINKENKKK
jgi:hypothetical protein